MQQTIAQTTSTNWFVSWFNSPTYLKLYQHRSKSEAVKTVNTILEVTGLSRALHASLFPLSALDIACGAGRHAIELAAHGFAVTANDLSSFLLNEARQAAQKSGTQLHFTGCDMRDIDYIDNFHLIVQLFTSFGYFENLEDDRHVLRKIYLALKENGWYVLDFLNKDYIEANLNPKSVKEFDAVTVTEERAIRNNRVEKRITIDDEGEQFSFMESVRLYSRAELEEMLISTGFSVEYVLGDYDGSLFHPEKSKRLIFFAKKKQSDIK
ncbi:Methyltransferase type 11 [Chloroherpeton thalassium ATCC 35110]|uniref:Methyltransferase type 11 n=1 Tax=Chloroherpeton thalassium (strain ATCC 35110 / GB-78) TaxID=517418 RepID=B3QX57_CHLT3|nr:class I SAM-dependent methyltransferase [Chloroherpeton thalassium]ACF14867.1 Methyltransferase type 11 [Chloroherpeton thalassium ATCC 35110]